MSQYAEIAFADAAVPDLPHILSSLRPGVRAVVLGAAEPASAQMARALAGVRDVGVIHILTHGRPGELSFAAGALSSTTLDSHRDDLRAIGRSLTADGEIRLWACDTARGTYGATFVERLAAVTGARIAASTGRIGAAVRGGSWQLDADASEVPAPLTAAGLAGYGGVLSVITDITFTSEGEFQLFTYIDGVQPNPTFSNTLTLTGSAAGNDDLEINLGSLATSLGGPTVLDMSGWTFVNWNSTDRIRVYMGVGDDTLILGSNSVLGPLDVYDGNGFQPLILPGEVNIIQIGTADTPASVDFTATGGFATFLGFTQLAFANNSGTSTATFNNTPLATVINGSVGTNALVFKFGTDLSGYTFNNWTNGDDSITIFATAANESIIGSSQDDVLSVAVGAIQSGDLYDGGGGTDTLLLTGGGTFDFTNVPQDATHGFHNIEQLTFDGGALSIVKFDGATQFASGSGLSTVTVTGSSAPENLQFTRKAGQTGGAYDLSGLQFTNWTSGDTIDIFATLGVDNIAGTSQDDIFVFAASAAGTQVNAGDSFDGGSGNDTIQIGNTGATGLTPIDFSPATLANFEWVTFTNSTGPRTVTFTSSQFGAGKISNAVTFTGTSSINAVVVNMATDGALDMSGWSFAGWTNGTDTLTVNGSTGGETIAASTTVDTILGGAGNDTIVIAATADVNVADKFDGGTGTDTIQIGTAGPGTSIDLSGAASDGVNGFLNFEAIAFGNTSGLSTGAFSSAQFGAGKITSPLALTGSAGANALVVNMAAAGTFDMSGWTFGSWTNGTDTLTVNGTVGDDTFIFGSGVPIGAGSKFDGGAGTNTIQIGTAATATSINLNAASTDGVNGFLNIEDIVFTNSTGTSTAAFSSAQFGAGKISNSVTITGSAGTNALVLVMNTPGPPDLAGWTFSNWTTGTDTLTVRGSAAYFASLTGGDLATMASQGVTAIGSNSGSLALTVDQYLHLGSLAVLPPALIRDTAANIEALLPSDLAGMAGKNIKILQYSDQPLVLSLDQYDSLGGVLLPTDHSTALQVSASDISGFSTGFLGGLYAGGVSRLIAPSAVTVNAARAAALSRITVSAPSVTLADSSAAIAALTVKQLGGLAGSGFTTIDVSDNALTLTVSQFRAIRAVALAAGDTVTLKDSWANISTLDLGTLGARNVDSVYVTNVSFSISAAQYGQLLAGGTDLTGPAAATLTGFGSDIAALDIAGLAANGISKIDASDNQLALTVDQYTNLNGVQLTAGDTVTLKDTSSNIGNLTPGQIGGLAAGRIDLIDVTSPGGALSWRLDQFNALGTVLLKSDVALALDGAGGNDTFTFSRQTFSAADQIDGEGGTDTLALTGSYGNLVFNADTIANVEKLKVYGGGHGYSITENNGNVAANQTLVVAAVNFGAGDSFSFDGSAETDGSFSFTGGGAGSTSTFTGGNKADTFTAGAGADTIRYTSAAQSTSAAYDTVNGFDTSSDSFFWSQSITFDGTVNALLRTTTLDDNLATAFGSIAANHAAIVEASGGNLSGQMFLLINDGTVGYQTGDLVVRLTGTDPATFSSANFMHS